MATVVGRARGRGRGRGRGVPKLISIIADPEEENQLEHLTISNWAAEVKALSTSNAATLPVPGKSTPSARIKIKSLNEQVCALSDIKPPVCVNLGKVNLETGCVYVKFENHASISLRKALEDLKSFYDSEEGFKYILDVSDISEDEIVILKDDEQGCLHRVKILSPRLNGTAMDLDNMQEISLMGKSIFQLTGKLLEMPLEMVEFRVEINENKRFQQWMEENILMLESKNVLERSLMSALEMCEGKNMVVAKARRKPEDDLITLSIEVLASKTLKKHFLHALILHSIPRTPEIGSKRIAWITNVRDDWKVDIVFINKCWFGLREAIYNLQQVHDLSSPQSPSQAGFFLKMVECSSTDMFLAPLKNNWKELYRVKVLKINPKTATVRYIDMGKTDVISIRNLAAPLRANFVPELMQVIPPLATTVNILRNLDSLGLNLVHLQSLRTLLENKPAYLKVVEDNSGDLYDCPFVELHVLLENEVKSVSGLIRRKARLGLYGSDKDGTSENEEFGPGAAGPLIEMTKMVCLMNEHRQSEKGECLA